MIEKSNVYELKTLIEDRAIDAAIDEQNEKALKMYDGDFKRFKIYCEKSNRLVNFDSLEKYLYKTIIEDRLKLATFNRRSAAISYYLKNKLQLEISSEQNKRIKLIRKMYDNVENVELKLTKGQKSKNKSEVIDEINKLDPRAKAIALVNLVTACRPSEMVRIKLKHIDFENSEINIYMKKQKTWITKRITLQVVNALKEYQNLYDLKEEDYLVGHVDKHNNYKSSQISEAAYRKAIQKWLKFAPYTLRKTQISAMHLAGADLATIAKQSGHKSLQTINEHYLDVSKNSIDKYL